MSERRIDPEGMRRLKEAGFVPEASPTGKQRWQDPETGRMTPVGTALTGWSAGRSKSFKRQAGSAKRSRVRTTGANPGPDTCTLSGPHTTCTSAGTKDKGRNVTSAFVMLT